MNNPGDFKPRYSAPNITHEPRRQHQNHEKTDFRKNLTVGKRGGRETRKETKKTCEDCAKRSKEESPKRCAIAHTAGSERTLAMISPREFLSSGQEKMKRGTVVVTGHPNLGEQIILCPLFSKVVVFTSSTFRFPFFPVFEFSGSRSVASSILERLKAALLLVDVHLFPTWNTSCEIFFAALIMSNSNTPTFAVHIGKKWWISVRQCRHYLVTDVL